jgi:hypothetical protein
MTKEAVNLSSTNDENDVSRELEGLHMDRNSWELEGWKGRQEVGTAASVLGQCLPCPPLTLLQSRTTPRGCRKHSKYLEISLLQKQTFKDWWSGSSAGPEFKPQHRKKKKKKS